MPPVKFSTAEKAKVPTVPALTPVIDHTLVALGPIKVSAVDELPTSFSMARKPPVFVAAPAARLTVTAIPPSPE